MPLKHTPTPWELVNGTGIYSALGADSGDGLKCSTNDGWHIAEIGETPANVDGVGEVELGQDTKEANARHIVKCVNYHDRLVKALRVALELADDHPSMPSTGHIHAILDELENNQ